MATPHLKLADSSQSQPESYLMERRIATRNRVSGRVTALSSADEHADSQKRICSLQMLNISDTGLGAIVKESVEIGSQISVFFPPHGPEHGFDVCGTVVRCIDREGGHEIGVRIQPRLAA